jgi:hypothetical protein
MTQTKEQQLIEYTVKNLQSLERLADFFLTKNPGAYKDSIGGHLRHIIEHYEALILRDSNLIDYDARVRDEVLEESPGVAISRLEMLIHELKQETMMQIEYPVEVNCAGGQSGEFQFSHVSSIGRELCFLNSHCVHHLAIIKPICRKYGIPLDEYFGYAPSTIAYLESQKMEVL